MKKLLLTTTMLTLLGTTAAHADPITAAIAAVFGGGAVATAIAQVVVGLGLSVIGGKITAALQKDPQISAQFEVQFGDNNPLSFTVGDFITAGKRKYVGSWGPNTQNITEVIEVSCIPQGLAAIWVNDEPGDVVWGSTEDYTGRVVTGFTTVIVDGQPARRPVYTTKTVTLGHPVNNLKSSLHKIWIKWVDGTQTAADPLLIGVFGDDPDYPWTTDMIGTGKSYAIITTQYDKDTLTSYPSYLFQPEPLKLYDPRKDSTVGGSGSHRWGQPNTYEVTRNNAVIAYNIARGIYYGSEWIFGGQNLPAWRLPVTEWAAAMNECDALVALAAGGTEPAFRCGAEITVDMEPLGVMEQIGLAASMRYSEVGGRLKPVCGLPAASVFSFTDADLVVTEGQDLRPFSPMSNTFNRITASYPEPEAKWTSKDAPEYVLPDRIAEDGQDFPLAITYAAAPYKNQVQRLMRAQLHDSRREIVHEFTLPPMAYGLEPLDMVTWTSGVNGYTAKTFVVEALTKLPGMGVQVVLRECDPSDYDWSTGYELPTTVIPPSVPVQWLQEIFSFSASPILIQDTASVSRHAGIQVSCGGAEHNIASVRIKVTKVGDTIPLLDRSFEYKSPYQWILAGGGISPLTQYTVLAALVPTNLSTPYEWSAPVTVTTGAVTVTATELSTSLEDAIYADMEATAYLAGITPVASLPVDGSPDQVVMLIPPGRLYRWDNVAGAWVDNIFSGIEAGTVGITELASSLEVPLVITGAVPGTRQTSDLLFRTDDGKLYRWNGTAYIASVPTSDLTGTVSGAQIADAALTTAKFASTIKPIEIVAALPGPAHVEGRMVYLTADDKLYRNTGAGWTAAVSATDMTGQIVSTQITDGAISTPKIATGAIVAGTIAANAITAAAIAADAVTAGKIAAAAISARELAADSVTATKLFVGDTSNMVPDWSDGTMDGWANPTTLVADSTAGAASGWRFASADRNCTYGLKYVQVNEGETYYFSVWVYNTDPDYSARILARTRTAAGVVANYQVVATAVKNAWTRLEAQYTIPAGVTELTMFLASLKPALNTYFAYFTKPVMRRAGSGELIVDGAITAAKIAANTIVAGNIAADAITAAAIAADAVTAGKIAAAAISAREIAAGAITAEKLQVGIAGNLLANADFMSGTKHWTRGGWNLVDTATTFGLRGPGVSFAGLYYPVMQLYQNNTETLGYSECYSTPTFNDAGAVAAGVPVKPGDRLQAYAQLSLHRCSAQVYLQWIDATGVSLSLSLLETTPDNVSGSGTNPDLWETYGDFAIAPANAAYARLLFRKTGTTSGTTSYMMVHKPFLGYALANQTVFSPWDAGRVTKITGDQIITNAITANHIAAGAITAGKIAAGAIVASDIAAGTITGDKIAAASVTADKLDVTDLTVTGEMIVAGATKRAGFEGGNLNFYLTSEGTPYVLSAAIEVAFEPYTGTGNGGGVPHDNPVCVTICYTGSPYTNVAGKLRLKIEGRIGTGGAWTEVSLLNRHYNQYPSGWQGIAKDWTYMVVDRATGLGALPSYDFFRIVGDVIGTGFQYQLANLMVKMEQLNR